MLDRIDAGFSVLLHVPGFLAPGIPLTIDNLTIHAYLPPRQLDHHRLELESPIARMVQIFAEEIAFPHVLRAKEDRARSGIPSPSVEVTRAYCLSLKDKEHLSQNLIPAKPSPVGGPCFQFMACTTGELEKLLAKHSTKTWSTATDNSATNPEALKSVPQSVLNMSERLFSCCLKIGT